MQRKKELRNIGHKILQLNRQDGASLVEILIAISIFGIGIMAVASMQTSAVQTNSYAANLTRAIVDFNQKKAEDLLALDYGDSNLDEGSHPAEVQDEFSTSWNVLVNTPYLGAKEVTITTTWSDGSGNHTVNTTFVIGQFI